MTPKEKAKELVDKFDKAVNTHTNTPLKKCALIAVDEILNLMIKEFKWDIKHNGNIDYWREVKQEIEDI
jgi:hypothetical protein